MPRRPFRPQLTVRVVHVADPNAEETFARVLDLLADAMTDLAINEARTEVAGQLGLDANAIDHERGALGTDDRHALQTAELRGVA